MNTLIIILLIVSGLVPHALDVHSTAANNANPYIYEKRRMFRRLDGHCNLAKLVTFKAGLFAVCFAVSFGLYLFAAAGLIAFGVFPLMGIIAVPVVANNYKLRKRFKN